MPLPEAFDYAEPDGMGLQLGDQVAAPLGPRLLRGVVVGLREAAGAAGEAVVLPRTLVAARLDRLVLAKDVAMDVVPEPVTAPVTVMVLAL